MFGHDICLKGRLDTFSTFSVFKIHNSVSLWVKITKKPNSTGRPSLCLARKQRSNSETGCDVINRWIIGTRNFAKSWAPPLYRSYVGDISVNCRWYISQLSVVYRSTVGGISVNCRWYIGLLSFEYQSCVNLSGEYNGFFFKQRRH